MNLIIVDKKDIQLKTDNASLIIDGQKIPYRLIDTLLLVGKQQLYTSDLTKLSNAQIHIIMISYNYKESAIITSTNNKVSELKQKQYQASPLPIAKEILKKKIQTHIIHLKQHEIILKPDSYHDSIDKADNLEILLGIEGSFSKLYFGHYFSFFPKSLHKGKRSKRPPLDPLNALLSLYYTLFYNIIAIRLMAYGFETGIGFLHRPFRSHHALASDLLEIFRADINAFIYDIFAQKIVTKSDFTLKGGVYLKHEGRKKLWNRFKDFSHLIQPKIDHEISQLRQML
jgi:CRISPR-associated protein Cas1